MRNVFRGRLAASPLRGVATLAVAGLLLTGCNGGANGAIRTAPVGRETVSEIVEAPGSIAAKASATVTAPASGRIGTLKVGEGSTVDAGDVLLTIDSAQAREQLRQAQEADRQAASAGVVTPPATGLTAEQLRADEAANEAFGAARSTAGKIPDPAAQAHALSAIAAAQAQYEAARAQAEDAIQRFNAGLASLSSALSSLAAAQRVQTRAAVALAQRSVDALTVRAPISGVVGLGGSSSGAAPDTSALAGALQDAPEGLQSAAGSLLGGASGGSGSSTEVAVGSPVSAGEQLLTLTDVSELSLSAEVDETDVLLVKPGVRASAQLDAVPGATYPAIVRSVDVAPTASSGGGVAYVVKLALSDGSTAEGETAPVPRPGMSAIVDFQVRRARDALAVPVSAIVRDGARDAVFVVDGSHLRKRHVRLGAQGEDVVQILGGLREGERIVVSGADKARDGQQLT